MTSVTLCGDYIGSNSGVFHPPVRVLARRLHRNSLAAKRQNRKARHVSAGRSEGNKSSPARDDTQGYDSDSFRAALRLDVLSSTKKPSRPDRYLCRSRSLLTFFPFPSAAPMVVLASPFAAAPAPELRAINHCAVATLKHALAPVWTTRINPPHLRVPLIRIDMECAEVHPDLHVVPRQFLQLVRDVHMPVASILRAQNQVFAIAALSLRRNRSQ